MFQSLMAYLLSIFYVYLCIVPPGLLYSLIVLLDHCRSFPLKSIDTDLCCSYFLRTVMWILILCENKISLVCRPGVNVFASYYCLSLCILAWCGSVSESFVLFIFFIVWSFKLWKKGGRIGWLLERRMFYKTLVFYLVSLFTHLCFLCFSCVGFCDFCDLFFDNLTAAFHFIDICLCSSSFSSISSFIYSSIYLIWSSLC